MTGLDVLGGFVFMATGGGSSGDGTLSLAASGVWITSADGRSIILGSLMVSIDDGSAT